MPPSRIRSMATNLPPNIFAMVMATGIVSLAAAGAGFPAIARVLFVLNAVLYPILLGLFVARLTVDRAGVAADFADHAKAPGFFTMVAGPCVLGNQFVLLGDWPVAAAMLLGVGLLHWIGFTYLMLPSLMTAAVKPTPERGLSGAWLLIVVGTQALSVLTSLLLPRLSQAPEWGVFATLAFWLVGSMIYLWIISQIFNRILFLPLAPNDLTPPYWINMGAMAIATLAGARLVGLADRSPLLTDLLPFLKGMTLMFWATATWWIPILFALGVWRHLTRHFPLNYDHGYWAAVFPIGMYTVCTRTIIDVIHLPYLAPISDAFVWVALTAWATTFLGLVRRLSTAQTRLSAGSLPPKPDAR
jgi:tellurite resistance protein TehA-like permease